jgi:hypothetical protein
MRLSDEEWTRLLPFCNIAHLTLSIAQLPSNGFPQWVVEQLRTNLADNALRFKRIKATYREAAKALDRAGVEHIVIKGFTQSPDYVAHPRFRAQSDIDIFCPPNSILAARDALYAIGYKSSGVKVHYAYNDHIAALVRLGDWRWRGNPFDPEMPLGIELHYCFWNESNLRIRVPEVDRFWERRTTREIEGFSFPCLSPFDQLSYFSLHILRNVFIFDWIIHHVRELAVFLHSHADDDGFWQIWHETHSTSLRSYEAIAFFYARSWFDCRLHPLAAHEIDKLPATRLSCLQCFSGAALEIMFDQNKKSVWLHLSLLSSRREKWKVLKRALLPRQIGSIRSPSVNVRNKRVLLSAGRPLWQQYIAYLLSRSADYGRVGIITLWRGLSWHLSRHFRTLSPVVNGHNTY